MERLLNQEAHQRKGTAGRAKNDLTLLLKPHAARHALPPQVLSCYNRNDTIDRDSSIRHICRAAVVATYAVEGPNTPGTVSVYRCVVRPGGGTAPDAEGWRT